MTSLLRSCRSAAMMIRLRRKARYVAIDAEHVTMLQDAAAIVMLYAPLYAARLAPRLLAQRQSEREQVAKAEQREASAATHGVGEALRRDMVVMRQRYARRYERAML